MAKMIEIGTSSTPLTGSIESESVRHGNEAVAWVNYDGVRVLQVFAFILVSTIGCYKIDI